MPDVQRIQASALHVHAVVGQRRGMQHMRRLWHDAVQLLRRQWDREADSCGDPSFQSAAKPLIVSDESPASQLKNTLA